MCIVLGPFQEGIRPKKDSALIWSQWIHILLLFFLFDLFSFSVFASLLPHSPCWLPSSFDLICSYPSSCVSFLPCTRFMFLVSLPCTSCSPPLFCVYLVLAWQGTHDAGHTCWNILYSMCIVSSPFQEETVTKKKVPAISVGSNYAAVLSLFLVFFLFFFLGWHELP